jgi:hypothetical protein
MSELKELEDRWAVQMAAVYPPGHRHAGQRVFEVDQKYARATTALRVQIEELRAAEAARPQINAAQLAWLNRAQAAVDKTGKRLYQPGSVYERNVNAASAKVREGGDISGTIASTERAVAEMEGSIPERISPLTTSGAPDRVLMPPSEWHGGAGSPPVTTRGPQ